MKNQNIVFTFHFYFFTLYFLCPLWLKMVQSKIINYAKRTQFSKKSNVYKSNENNGLRRKNEIGHLVKTNPIKPNFTASGG